MQQPPVQEKRRAEVQIGPEEETSTDVAKIVGMMSVVDEEDTVHEAEASYEYEADDDTADHVELDDTADTERLAARHRGRLAEIDKMEEFKLAYVVTKAEAKEKGWRVLGWRWVDKERPEVWRCRYVVKDFKFLQPWRTDLYTPSSVPLTNRIIDAIAEAHGYRRLIADATNAFFHAEEKEDVCSGCPEEFLERRRQAGLDTEVLFKFRMKIYGRRDGPSSFCDFCSDVLVNKRGMTRCTALPCFFWHSSLKLALELHQDDFHATGPDTSLLRMRGEFGTDIRLKFSPLLGDGVRYSHLKAVRHVTNEGTLP